MTRTLRIWLAAAMSAISTVLALGVTTPAEAHGSVAVSIHSDGRGSVWVIATWEDGHPIAQRVAAALLAYAQDGQRVGPAPLVQGIDGPGTLRFNGVLTPGVWTVAIDVADPGVRHCTAVVPVADATATPKATNHGSCGGSARLSTARAAPSRGVSWWPLLGLVPLVVLGGATFATIRRRGNRSGRRAAPSMRSRRHVVARPRRR
jgi:hypothetical protein